MPSMPPVSTSRIVRVSWKHSMLMYKPARRSDYTLTQKKGRTMTKVGILTFQNTLNYGALFQSYALYEVVSELGYDTEVIDYHCPAIEMNEGLDFKLSEPKTLLKFIMKLPKQKVFNRFRDRIAYSPSCNLESIAEVAKGFDHIIVGSDQVWNPNIIRGDLTYFLPFEVDPDHCKTYAASIGIDEFPTREPYRTLISHFSSLLMREQTAVNEILRLLPEPSNAVPQTVCDPTLLLGRQRWQRLAEKPAWVKDKEYVLVYSVSEHKQSGKVAKQLAKEYGCDIVQIRQRRQGKIPGAIHCRNLSPEEFLGLFAGAKAVVVSSFHGICFSLLFEKDFFVTMSDSGKSRMTDIMSSFDIEDHIVDGTRKGFQLGQLDYLNDITPKLNEMRVSSLAALCLSLD